MNTFALRRVEAQWPVAGRCRENQEVDVLQRWRGGLEGRYGRRLGLKRHLEAKLRLALGGFRRYQHVEWERVERLVFVCTGNLCRSAYAEHKARAMGLPTESFGLHAQPFAPADGVAAQVALARGVDLSPHRARVSSQLRLGPGDLLLAMEPWQAEALEVLTGGSGAQVTLLGLWSRPPRAHLEDPFGLSPRYFETCMDFIDGALERVAEKLRRR